MLIRVRCRWTWRARAQPFARTKLARRTRIASHHAHLRALLPLLAQRAGHGACRVRVRSGLAVQASSHAKDRSVLTHWARFTMMQPYGRAPVALRARDAFNMPRCARVRPNWAIRTLTHSCNRGVRARRARLGGFRTEQRALVAWRAVRTRRTANHACVRSRLARQARTHASGGSVRARRALISDTLKSISTRSHDLNVQRTRAVEAWRNHSARTHSTVRRVGGLRARSRMHHASSRALEARRTEQARRTTIRAHLRPGLAQQASIHAGDGRVPPGGAHKHDAVHRVRTEGRWLNVRRVQTDETGRNRLLRERSRGAVAIRVNAGLHNCADGAARVPCKATVASRNGSAHRDFGRHGVAALKPPALRLSRRRHRDWADENLVRARASHESEECLEVESKRIVDNWRHSGGGK